MSKGEERRKLHSEIIKRRGLIKVADAFHKSPPVLRPQTHPVVESFRNDTERFEIQASKLPKGFRQFCRDYCSLVLSIRGEMPTTIEMETVFRVVKSDFYG